MYELTWFFKLFILSKKKHNDHLIFWYEKISLKTITSTKNLTDNHNHNSKLIDRPRWRKPAKNHRKDPPQKMAAQKSGKNRKRRREKRPSN